MDRGTETMNNYLSDMKKVSVRQTRRGWFQELLGCEAKTEFKLFSEGTDQFATALEDSNCCLRLLLPQIRPFTMKVEELETGNEILTVDRQCALPLCALKCCCFQEMSFESGGQNLGKIEEQCYYFVPIFKIYDENDNPVYKVHQPTCVGGLCVNCCAAGNPCGKGCCKVPFNVYPESQEDTHGGAPYIGRILKVPKSLMTELFTDAEAFDVTFPEDATSSQKAMLIGSAIFLNAIFFEGQDNAGDEAIDAAI